MFRPSGPDHVLALTGKIFDKPHWKWVRFVANPNSKCGQKVKVRVKVKVRGTIQQQISTKLFFKKVAPQGRDCPSPPRPRAPPCRDFSPPVQLCIIFVFQGRAGSAHMSAPGRTPGRESGAGWFGSKTLLPGDKDCVDGDDLPSRLASWWWVALRLTLADAQTLRLPILWLPSLRYWCLVGIHPSNSSLCLDLSVRFEHLRLLSFSVASEIFLLSSSQSVQMASPPFFPDVFLECVSKEASRQLSFPNPSNVLILS